MNEMCNSVPTRIPVAYVNVRFFVHATEDLEKVVKAAKKIFPPNDVDDIVFEKKNLRGHYGNPIILFKTKVKGRKTIKLFIENLSSNMSRSDKEILFKEVDLHVGRGNLYIRLNKQSALQGELILCKADPVHVRIRFRNNKLEDIIKICQEFGLLPLVPKG